MMRRPGGDDLSQATLHPLMRMLIGVVVPFAMAVGGIALAAWATDEEYEVLVIVGLCIAGCGFLWLFLLSAMFSSWSLGGDGVSLSLYVIIGLIALGGGAAVIFGAGLLMLGLLAAPVLVVLAIWGWISSGFSLFD